LEQYLPEEVLPHGRYGSTITALVLMDSGPENAFVLGKPRAGGEEVEDASNGYVFA
jgi:hypothetical protein